MGGDDLGSDDEQWISEKIEDNEIGEASTESNDHAPEKQQKRKAVEEIDENKSQNKKSKSPEKLLLEAGRQLECQNAIQQSCFLNAAISHYNMLKTAKEQSIWKVEPDRFKTSSKQSLVERLSDTMSLKKIKKWKNVGSPCVVIVCISARRSVSILKDLSILKVRVAKLFPKNGSIDEQTKQLSTLAFGIAVGTPHRLLSLCQAGSDPKKGPHSLLDRVNLIVFDSDVSNKQYTVCTLPDTAPQCMELLTDFAIPQMMKRDDMHLAFF